jgi:hypothetical protein
MAIQEKLAMILVRRDMYEEALKEIDDWLSRSKADSVVSYIPKWAVANVESLKGECLSKLGRHDDASAILNASHQVLVTVIHDVSIRQREANVMRSFDRLMELAKTMGNSDRLSELQKEKEGLLTKQIPTK